METEEQVTISLLNYYQDETHTSFTIWEGSERIGQGYMTHEAFEVFRFALRAGWAKAHPGKFDFAYKEYASLNTNEISYEEVKEL